MRTHQFTIRESAPPGLVAFRARILAAVPGKSLNGRIYTRELLKQTAPLYPSSGINPRPFTLDHDIEHCERVVGLITGARYDVEEAMNGDQIEGLWLDAMGYMEEKLFAKVQGTKTVPAFIRGVSIGGEGEGEWTGNGVLIRNFKPAELALTPFPGIPTAHIAAINLIREHYLNPNSEVKNTTIQIRENDLSLEDAEKQAANDTKNPRKIREGPLPSADVGVNDVRPGLPRPTVRTNVLHIQPQATTSSDAGFRLNPEDGTSSMNKGFMSAPGTSSQRGRTGMPTEAAPGTAGSPGSKDAKTAKIKVPKTGNTTTTHPGPGNLSPSGAGMDSEEEEESMQDLGDQTHPNPRKTDRSLQKNPMMSKPGENPHAKDGEEEEEETIMYNGKRYRLERDDAVGEEELDGLPSKKEEEEEEERQRPRRIKQHGPSPHIPGKPIGKQGSKANPATGSAGDTHAADNAYDSPSDKSSEEEETQRIRQHDEPVGVTPGAKPGTDSSDDRSEEEEEEDGVTIDPIRKMAGQGQHVNANPTKEEKGPQVLFSEAEPIQARAFSLPTNSGILATLSQLAAPDKAKAAMEQGGVEELVKQLTRPDNTMTRENVAQLIEAWNRGKMPKEEVPRKIIIRKPGIGSSKDVSIPDARPVPEIAESVVRTRSVTNIAPTMAATSVSTLPTSRLDDLLSEEKKRPYSNVSYLNPAKRAWNRAVQELIQFQ